VRKRFYIMFVARDADGELLKIPIPLHYLYVFVAGAVLGMLVITGMAGSYTRMVLKTLQFNDVRAEKEALRNRYQQLEKVAEIRDAQVASLGSLASEVSLLYGLRQEADLTSSDQESFEESLGQLHALRQSAMSGAATLGIGYGRSLTTADWLKLAAAPTLWPVQGSITSHFGERIDPFQGEGSFHAGVDINAGYGAPVLAPADGTVSLSHGNGISTLFGHLSSLAVTPGQHVTRGDVIGYVGSSGRSTGAHLHYEVRINNTPVNPHRYLRTTVTRMVASKGAGSVAGE
jgi:murein DD-endopeptidase MepM/ murein hydrolase activator NlpD